MHKPKFTDDQLHYDAEHGNMSFLIFNQDDFVLARHITSVANAEGQRGVEEAEQRAKNLCASNEAINLLWSIYQDDLEKGILKAEDRVKLKELLQKLQ